MFDDVIKLIKDTDTTDYYGDLVKTTTERTLYAQVKSVGQSEFYQAQAVGLKPEIKFVIADFYDYQGEQQLKYTPYGGTEQVYDIIRTYRNNTNLEIVCKRGIE